MEERTRYNEIMCYGIDLALCNLNWRPEAKRFMVVITDEELKTNYKPKYQREEISSGKLKERIEKMGVIFHFITPHRCLDYKKLEMIDKALWHPIEHENEFGDPEKIQKIFAIIVKSVSKSLSIPIGQ